MGFLLEQVVPWGRSFDEYLAMFSLMEVDLGKRILGCGDGPAGFNAELTRRGGKIVSVDPIYQYSADEIKSRVEATYETVLAQTRKNQDEFIWESIKSVDELGKVRMEAMNQFLEDYPKGKAQGRYVVGELPMLEFSDKEFNLALCSHFLFLYSEHFTTEFHIQSIVQLCRVADEVRVFPLLELGARKSRHLKAVIEYLVGKGYECTVEKVEYEFQKRGNEMLRVKSSNRISRGFSPPLSTPPRQAGSRLIGIPRACRPIGGQ